jgi:D-alanine--poly(phosphoribitol) ligase subunit 1
MLINVLEYLEATERRFPQKCAVSDATGALTFAELTREARLLAGRILARTGARNEPIGVFLPKSRECVTSFAAILYSGNCYAPLDLKSPAPRMTALLEKLQPTLVITDRARLDDLRKCGLPDERILCLDGEESAAPVEGIPAGIDTDPVYIIHTSGSTGVPKGVVISHRSVIDYIDWAIGTYRVDETAVIGSQAPFHFDNSTLDLYLCFATGAALDIVPEDKYLFPAKLLEHLRERQINFIFWVPSVLVSVANLDLLRQVERPPLQHILFAGEVMPTRHLNYWRKWFPQALFSNLYGPTEITVDCTYYILDRELADDEPTPIGFPCRNSDVLILNEDNRRAAPGERGELCVRGTSLALGYWNDPEKTAAVFCQNPLQPHYPERIYRTGDIVYTNELGEIVFAGRTDTQIKHQGYRIELGEIETAVLSLPDIRNACALYDAQKSQIVLWLEAENAVDAGWLRRELLQRLPRYMLPAVIRQADSMPLNANGKIDRRKLAAAAVSA